MLMYSNKTLITITAFVNTSVHSFKSSRGAAKALIFRGDVFRSAAAFDFLLREMITVIKECGRAPTCSLQREVLFLSSLCYHSTPSNPRDAFTVTDTELLLKSHMISCWALFLWR